MIPERNKVKKAGLLVSARSVDEADLVMQSGTGWLDLKDPSRGPLGRPNAELVTLIQERVRTHNQGVPDPIRFSVAGGEACDWSHQWGMDFVGRLGPTACLKIATAGLVLNATSRGLLQEISQQLQNREQLILVHYADWRQCNGPDWRTILELSRDLGCCYTLIDTFEKRSGSLTDYYPEESLPKILMEASTMGLSVALAGSIPMEQLSALAQLDVAWIGIRGAVCEAAGRNNKICIERLQAAINQIEAGNLLRTQKPATYLKGETIHLEESV